MVVIRPAKKADIDQIMDLASLATYGLTSMPKDRDLLAKRIAQSELSFQLAPEAPGGELYLFVMEDLSSAKVIGTSGIMSKVGGFEPFYAYEIQVKVHESKELGVRKEIEILRLVTQHSGPSEIGGLLLHPEYRKYGNGRLLSLFRFLFMAQHSQRFEPLIIAEMRGFVDEHGHSPFWEALGRHFFDMDFPKADYLSVKNKKFIADLMPDCPIYIPLLPKEAQKVVGKVHPHTEPAIKMLKDEGFRNTGMVDIFEAGPIISCSLKDVRIVKQSRKATVEAILTGSPESEIYLVTNTGPNFRACMATLSMNEEDHVRIGSKAAQTLKLETGATIVFSPLKPPKIT